MRFDVHLDKSHLERIRSSPRRAITELIWNALDADAELVTVELGEGELGGVETVVVTDDGHGMTKADAEASFTSLGGSWKEQTRSTRTKQRALHGREGRGRFFAATQAGRIRWESVAEDDDGRRLTVIEIRRPQLQHCDIDDRGGTDCPVGTTVILDAFDEAPPGLQGDSALDALTTTLAVYLTKYPVEVRYAGTSIDPKALQVHARSYEVIETDEGPVELDVIEWSKDLGRRLYLCDSQGTVLGEQNVGIHAPDFFFTAYVRWAGFASEQALDLAGLDSGPIADVLDAARTELRQHFKERLGDEQRRVIAEWKEAEIYPYSEEPRDQVEEITRELFDVVAVKASPAITGPDSSRRLSLRLLREAIETQPGSLRRVLEEVVDLQPAELAELNELLGRTNLAAVVSAARTITDRLDFLRVLEELVFEPEVKKRVKERAELHRILAGETWIFGEEYALMADDESLTTVLKRHLKTLGRDELAPGPVVDSGGRTRILDLMLGRSIEHARKLREHLVVELKAPSVKLGPAEIDQIENYADAVVSDPQFDLETTRWDFVVVSTEMTSPAVRRANQRDRPRGLVVDYPDADVQVWARTWSEIIDDADHRMKFVREALGYRPDRDAAIRYLHERHREVMPESLRLAM